MYNMKTRFRIMLEGPVIECDKGRWSVCWHFHFGLFDT